MREAASREGLQTPRPRKSNSAGAGGQGRHSQLRCFLLLIHAPSPNEGHARGGAPREGASWGGRKRHERSYGVCSADMFRMKA